MKKIPITFDSDEWELIVRTLDKAYPERPPPGSPDTPAYRRYEQLVNRLHKARQDAP